MKLLIYTLVFLVLTTLYISSCAKDDEVVDLDPPHIISPTITSVQLGQNLIVNFDVITPAGYKSAFVTAIGGTADITSQPTEGSTTGKVEINFTAANVERTGSITITVKDKEGDEKSVTVNFLISEDSGNELFGCEECDYVVKQSDWKVDGEVLGIEPGDVIGLSADIDYEKIRFENINGTAENPVIIRNCGGQALIVSDEAYGIVFYKSKYFKFLGDGSPADKYGIKISTMDGFFLYMVDFTTNFEIANIEIAGPNPSDLSLNSGFAGIGIKTAPYCDGSSNRGVWTMENVIVRDNYIHDTGGEGMYIGHGFYGGRIEPECDVLTFSHSINGLRVYNNYLENIGHDGLQIKNADEDVMVYNNIIKNYGVKGIEVHNEGILLGEGTTGKIFNNWVQEGTGTGIFCLGIGNLDIYNNVIISPGEWGFFAAFGPYAVRYDDGYFNIMNNTFIDAKDGLVFYDSEGGTKRIINNLIAKVNGEFIANGAPIEMSNNLTISNLDDVGFEDWNNNNFHLTESSEAINTGMDVSEFNIDTDFDGVARPEGGAYDIGAFEFNK